MPNRACSSGHEALKPAGGAPGRPGFLVESVSRPSSCAGTLRTIEQHGRDRSIGLARHCQKCTFRATAAALRAMLPDGTTVDVAVDVTTVDVTTVDVTTVDQCTRRGWPCDLRCS